MPVTLLLLIGGVAGVGLGVIFFGGLWWTTQRLVTSPRPASLAAGSLLARLGLLGTGLYVVSQLGAVALLAAAAGMLAVRQWTVRQIGTGSETGATT